MLLNKVSLPILPHHSPQSLLLSRHATKPAQVHQIGPATLGSSLPSLVYVLPAATVCARIVDVLIGWLLSSRSGPNSTAGQGQGTESKSARGLLQIKIIL